MIKKKNLIAFYGGTFDPIHYGHLYTAISLANLINIKKIILLPNNIPPHKKNPVASAEQRLIMANLAISEIIDSPFILDKRELYRPMYSWTIDTFHELRYIYGPCLPLGFIIGQDSFNNFLKWKKSLELLKLCHILVCYRPNFNKKKKLQKKKYWFSNKITNNPKKLCIQSSGLIYFASTPSLYISSSDIRTRYQLGKSCKHLLPISVQYYIKKQGLYNII